MEHKRKVREVPSLLEIVSDPVLGPYLRRSKESKLEMKRRTSEFFLTINSNQIFQDCSLEFKQKFRDWMVELFDEKEILGCLVDQSLIEEEKELDLFKNVTFEKIVWKMEVGRKQGRLHTHARISLEHRGSFYFDTEYFCKLSKERFGKRFYVNVQRHPNKVKNWDNYIMKDDVVDIPT